MNPQFGQATSTYQHVQERNEDLRKIEQSIAELDSMMRIMSVHVEEQGDTLEAILNSTQEACDDTHAGCVSFLLASSFPPF
jgi:t-SNARE complex subunit (syntaxin)